MEEGSLNHQNGVQMAPQGGSVPINKQGEETKAQYSIPGILHFIQHEWARFELERSQWEVDRAELQVGTIFSRTTPFSTSRFHIRHHRKIFIYA